MPSKVPSWKDPRRQPLGDVTARANNELSTPPRQQKKSPSSPLAAHHHQSLKAGHLQATEVSSTPENKRVSAITNESQRDSKRSSEASSTSTNASGGRPRKRHIGPWLLGSTLGTGATGRVRKAKHAVTNQVAAVKVVSKRNATDLRSQSVLQMDRRLAAKPLHSDRKALPFGIEREVVIMKLIEHPNIIKLYDLWENRGELYLVMEYVQGGELFNYIVDHRYLEEYEAVRIFRQIISAVGYCHEFKVCHRDIKPENILLDSIGNVKLVDFGMASREHHGGLATSCGSPHYAPPEIALGHKYRGAQADIWSCGIVLYVMLCGQLPFGTSFTVPDEVQMILQEVTQGDIRFPSEITANAADLIDLMLAPLPGDRIPIQAIWAHPLLIYYDCYVKHPDYAPTWIGGPPAPLNHADCGEPIKRREDVDLDVLRGLCTLWHSNNQERMIANLMSSTPNYEKIIYQSLLKFRIEQEENYQGVAIEISGSDYHHVTKRPIRRTATRSSLLGPGPKKSSSQFSIAEPSGSRHTSTKSRAAVSDADTEQSYDPYRPSRHQMIPTNADHAKITLLKGSSVSTRNSKHASHNPSLRHPAVVRLQQEHSSSLGSSPPAVARDANGRIRELRRQSIPRQDTSSSWASTRISRDGSAAFHKSASYKRSVVFQHKTRSSSLQRTPPPRPRNPTPLTLQQRFTQDATSSERDPFSTPPPAVNTSSDPMSASPPPIRSRKETVNGKVSELESKAKNRTSAIWEERTRQVSAELSNLCDEVFQGSTEPSTHLLDRELEAEKLRAFARKSLDLPSFRPAEIEKLNAIGPPPQRPLPEPPVQESAAMQTYRQLAQTKERLDTLAKALGSHELDNIIHQIDRLIATNAEKVTAQEHKRIQSAPDPRGHDFQNLSPVREEDDGVSPWVASGSSRHVSEPIQGSKSNRGYQQAVQNVDAWNYPYSIRPVNDDELRPRPLTIKKKASEPILNSPSKSKNQEHDLRARLRSGNASTSALDKLFGSSTKLDHYKSRTGQSFPSSQLDTIGELDGRTSGQKDAKRNSGDGKGMKWFRRSGGASSRSSNASGSFHEPGARGSHSTTVEQSSKTSDFHFRDPSNGTADDISFRPAQKEKQSTTTKLLKFFGKKDKRMHIAMTTEEDASSYGAHSTTDSHQDSTSAYAHAALTSPGTHDPPTTTGGPRRLRFTSTPPPTHSSPPHTLGGTAHNWFARFLAVKPARCIVPLSIPRDRALKEIHSILRDWRRYGIHNITLDKRSARISAIVDETNALGVKPVTLLVEVFPVAMRGRAQGMAVARFGQQKGAKSSFNQAMFAMKDVLKGRGVLVEKKAWKREMKKALVEWEGGVG